MLILPPLSPVELPEGERAKHTTCAIEGLRLYLLIFYCCCSQSASKKGRWRASAFAKWNTERAERYTYVHTLTTGDWVFAYSPFELQRASLKIPFSSCVCVLAGWLPMQIKVRREGRGSSLSLSGIVCLVWIRGQCKNLNCCFVVVVDSHRESYSVCVGLRRHMQSRYCTHTHWTSLLPPFEIKGGFSAAAGNAMYPRPWPTRRISFNNGRGVCVLPVLLLDIVRDCPIVMATREDFWIHSTQRPAAAT